MSEPRTPPVDPRLLRYARASRGFFVALAAIALGQTIVIIAFAWLLTRTVTLSIDIAAGATDAGALGPTLGALAGVIAVRAALIGVRDAVAARAAARVQRQLRDGFVDAVTRLGPVWLQTRSTAGLTLVAGRGLDALEAYFGRYLPQLVQTVIATPVIVAIMWCNDWLSGLTVVLTMPTIPVFMVLIGLATRSVQDRQWQTLSRLATRFSDTVRGLSTLRIFGRDHRAAARIESITDDYRRETMTVLRVSFLSGFALELLASIAVAIVAVEIGFRLLGGSLSLGVGLFVLLLAPEAFLPLRQVGVQFHAAAEGVAATRDVFAVLDENRARSADASPRVSASIDPAARGTGLAVERLAVHRGSVTLPAVSFEATPGTVTLITGPSGAGKSSLFAALRGAAPYEGTFTVDGIDGAALPASRWLAWSGQGAGLMLGTVAENVALGESSPDDAVIARALALAAATPAAGILPGLSLGAGGAGLSGGQAQRVAVARAIHRLLSRRASVLALDEPSAALDETTERELWAHLRSLADDGATILLISHRVSARTIADRVVTLDAAAAAPAPAPTPTPGGRS